jgi:hypothetical protein
MDDMSKKHKLGFKDLKNYKTAWQNVEDAKSKKIKKKDTPLKSNRKCYHDVDLVQFFKEIEIEKEYQEKVLKRKKNNTIDVVIQRHHKEITSTIKKYYKMWKEQGKPDSFIIDDQRKNSAKKLALTEEIEIKIAAKIIDNFNNQSLVSYSLVSDMAKSEWKLLHPGKPDHFRASNGWVFNFKKRNSLSSRLASMKSGSQNVIKDSTQQVNEYKNSYKKFINENGCDFVFNYDETYFNCGSAKLKTIVPKNCKDQPKIKNIKKDHRFSIGCTITAAGKKLKPILVTVGKTDRCLEKYKDYQNDKRCILTNSDSGWFKEKQAIMMLDIIYEYTKGVKSLCILDVHSAHQTELFLSTAKSYNIQLLMVPEKLTWSLQPLDVKVNGPYKRMMKTYWISKKYNEDNINYYPNLCDTILECYYRLPEKLIKDSFECMI